MPFQPINFANIAPQGNPFFRDLVDSLISGYKSGQVPAQLERQRQKEEIENAMSKLLFEEEPQRFKTAQEKASADAEMAKLLLQEQPELFKTSQEKSAIDNEMARLLLKQQPQRFRTEQGTSALANALTRLQVRAAEMEVDPKKKAAYVNELANFFNSPGGSASTAGASDDIRRALIRKNLGLPAQTSEEKIAQELEIYRRKKQLEGSLEIPTSATVTANQKTIAAIDNVLPIIKELKEMKVPDQVLGKYFSRNKQASYKGKVGESIDTLIAALKLPGIKESLHIVEDISGRQPWESRENYNKRLDNLTSDLLDRRKRLTGAGNSDANKRLRYNPKTGAFE